MHVLLATAIRIKHIDLFLQLEEPNDSYAHLVVALKTVQASPSPDRMEYLEEREEYIAFMTTYDSLCDETRAGKHGVNAQFWRNYIDNKLTWLIF